MSTIRYQRRLISGKISILVALSVLLLYTQGDAGTHKKTSLWKLKSEKNTVYMLGSIHLLKKESFPLPEPFEAAFDDSQALVMETDPDVLVQAGMQKLVLSKALYPAGQSLKGNISATTYELARKRAEELGLNIEQLNGFKPWFLSATLSVLKLKKLGFDPEYGVDKYFFDRAKKTGKEIISLETAEYQLDRLSGMPAPLQEDVLVQSLKDFEAVEEQIDKIVGAWISGDTDTLETTVLKTLKEYPQIYNRLVTERNKIWLPKIEGLIGREKNFLVVVGAGHLIGADSLISLLKDKGYAVEQ